MNVFSEQEARGDQGPLFAAARRLLPCLPVPSGHHVKPRCYNPFDAADFFEERTIRAHARCGNASHGDLKLGGQTAGTLLLGGRCTGA